MRTHNRQEELDLKKRGEKRLGEDTNQPTRRVKVAEPQGEKRKDMETDFEEQIRSLQTQANNLGLSKTDVLDSGEDDTENLPRKTDDNHRRNERKLVQQAPKLAQDIRDRR
jgi:hypothetical protein